MKKVAIVAPSAALEGEKGYSRFRTLAEILSEHYEVDLIISTFQHWEKIQRDPEKIDHTKRYRILLAYAPSYKRNVDIQRIYSQHVNANNILRIIKKNNYDLLYNVIPGNRKARLVAKYAKKNNIKSIIDVEDLWPEAMEMVFSLPPILDRILYYPFRRDARLAYSLSDGVIGTSDEYRDIPINKYGINIPLKRTVYVGFEYKEYQHGINRYSNEIKKSDNEFWVIYAGTLGSSYDIGTLIKAAQQIYKMGFSNIKFKILGSGPLRGEFEDISKQSKCQVDFLGYVPYGMMAAFLCKSDITINSFVKKAPQSIVTKIGDYLAAGIPMINTLGSYEFQAKVIEDGFGLNVEAENIDELVSAIIKLYNDHNLRTELGRNARKISEEQFDRRNSYIAIYDMIRELIGE